MKSLVLVIILILYGGAVEARDSTLHPIMPTGYDRCYRICKNCLGCIPTLATNQSGPQGTTTYTCSRLGSDFNIITPNNVQEDGVKRVIWCTWRDPHRVDTTFAWWCKTAQDSAWWLDHLSGYGVTLEGRIDTIFMDEARCGYIDSTFVEARPILKIPAHWLYRTICDADTSRWRIFKWWERR